MRVGEFNGPTSSNGRARDHRAEDGAESENGIVLGKTAANRENDKPNRRREYRVTALGPVPANLAELISEIHARALLQTDGH